MDISKLITSTVHEDIIIAVELMCKVDESEIKKLLPVFSDYSIPCWHTNKDAIMHNPPYYKMHPQGILYINNINIYFTHEVPLEDITRWGYKNLDEL